MEPTTDEAKSSCRNDRRIKINQSGGRKLYKIGAKNLRILAGKENIFAAKSSRYLRALPLLISLKTASSCLWSWVGFLNFFLLFVWFFCGFVGVCLGGRFCDIVRVFGSVCCACVWPSILCADVCVFVWSNFVCLCEPMCVCVAVLFFFSFSFFCSFSKWMYIIC